MQVVIGITIWFMICVFISSILTGGSSEATVPFTWLLFLGTPVGLLIYNIKSQNEKSSKEQKGDFTMKKSRSAIKTANERANIDEKTPVLKKAILCSETKLQEKLKVYNSLFENCQTLDEIIDVYVTYNDKNIQLKIDEIELLRHYLQLNSKFKSRIWVGEELANRIILASNNKNHQSLKDNIFATYVTDCKPQNSQYKNEPIKRKENADNSAYVLFGKMRKIREGRSNFYNNEDVFVKQGKFMEIFTDNFNGNASFQEYYPTYDSMGDKQLRTYFTWRTKIRNGVLTQTSLSYVFVYIYELINNIGVKNPNEGIEKLIWLLENYLNVDNKIKDYLVEWIKDYYICNKFTISFKEIVKQHNLEEYYPTLIVNENKYSFENLRNISKYKIEDSKFFTGEHERYIARCFDKIIYNLTPLLSLYGTDFDELISGRSETPTWWKPFSGAVYNEIKSEDKKVIIANNEIYILKNGQWMICKTPQHSNVAANVLGYIIKRIEANLRVLTNYRHKLAPNIDSFIEQIRDSYCVSKRIICVISDTAFGKIIDETTKLEFSALSLGKENMEVPIISKKLRCMLEEEPYLTFLKMRNSEELKGEYDKTKRFNIQAKLLNDLSDDFEIVIPFDSVMPTYDDMSNEQLRSYITWRSKVRNGEYSEISVSYIRLYVYELINNIGETNFDGIIEKLALLLRNYTKLNESFENLVTTCIKDYYICEGLSKSFYEVIKEHSIDQYYPNVFMENSEDLRIEGFLKTSNYDIFKSKFYSEQTSAMINDCFKYVFVSVERYFSNQNLNLKQIIIGKGYAKDWWRPFRNALCDRNPKTNRRVVICSNEVYSYQGNEWTCESMPQKDNTGTILIGYMIKRMEVNMRMILKFKYRLSTDISTIAKRIFNQKISNVMESPAFDQTIDDAVMQYFKEKYPRVFTNPNAPFEKTIEVKIDKSKLNKIRVDSEIIRDKLTLDDDIVEMLTVPPTETKTIIKTPKQFNSPLEELCDSLTEIQKETLIILLNESPSLPKILELSHKNNIMLEILLDGINEISLAVISDNLIETSEENPFIYDDYLKGIKMCLEEKNNGESGS